MGEEGQESFYSRARKPRSVPAGSISIAVCNLQIDDSDFSIELFAQLTGGGLVSCSWKTFPWFLEYDPCDLFPTTDALISASSFHGAA